MLYIDTHTHIDGTEFDDDRDAVIARAKEAGVSKMFVPAINCQSLTTIQKVCDAYPGYAYPMIGLHPEEVKADWATQLQHMQNLLQRPHPYIAIGEIGLDY